MNKLKELWNYFNGKKTIIGAVICFVVYVLKGVDVFFGVDFINAGLLTQVNEFGMTLMGIGLAHKAVKTM